MESCANAFCLILRVYPHADHILMTQLSKSMGGRYGNKILSISKVLTNFELIAFTVSASNFI